MRTRLFSVGTCAAAVLVWLLTFSSSAQVHWLDHWNVYSGLWNNIKAVIYVNNQFLALGDPGTVLTSPDGRHWTKTSGTDIVCDAVAFGRGLYVAVGYSIYGEWSGAIQASLDGITWTGGRYEGDSGPQLSDVVFASVFVTVGEDGKIMTLGNPGESC